MPATDEPYVRTGLAIINPYGGIWTDEIFQTPEEALKYLRAFWGADKDLSNFKLAHAKLEVNLELQHTGPLYISLPTPDRV